MALAPLLRSAAVLDLLEGDVVLPTHQPCLEKVGENAEDLRPKLASADVDARVFGLQAFLENPVKTLKTLSLSKARKSRFSVIGRALGARSSRHCAPSVAALTESVALIAGLLKRRRNGKHTETEPTEPTKPTEPAELAVVAEALSSALQLLQELPEDEDEFFHFLEKLLAKVRWAALHPGSVLLIPCGWLRRRSSAASPQDDLGHCVLLVLHRCKDEEEFLMGVINTGEGLQYHPASLSRVQPNPEMVLRQSPLILNKIPLERACSSAVWYLLFRQIMHPDPDNGADAMYGVLLPFLNQKPLSANDPEGSWHEPLPAAGDRSFALAVERSVRFMLVLSGMEESDASWWSSVNLRQALVECMEEALTAQDLRAPATGEFALLRVGISSLARAAQTQASRAKEPQLREVQAYVERLDAKALNLEHSQRHARSVQPPAWVATDTETRFGGFGRVLLQDVEPLKGEVKHGSLILPCLPSALPAEIKNCSEAAECCRLVSSMLTLMMNQQSRLPHAPASCFALVVHLMARLLPMPLPVDDAQPEACFWATDLTVETKKDLLRSLHMICRGFSAAATALSAARATREADGARTCVAAALVAVMDALLRRPLSSQLAENLAVQERHGDLFSLHYSGQSGQSGSQSGSSGFRGPCQPFVLGSGTFRETSEALLLPQPELAMLRAQALDYFQSLESEGSHAIFNFDQAMTPSSADRLLVEQLSLSIGLDAPAHSLLTGERPELIDFFPELGWLRDAVFLWKVLLLPPSDDKAARPSMSLAPLQWKWSARRKSRKSRIFRENSEEKNDGFFLVQGFEARATSWWNSRWQGLENLKRWLKGEDGYRSDFRSVSQANPSLLAGSKVQSEEDILALQSVPSFGALKASESELLLTYLVAPYLRIPLVLNFFWDKQRMTLLQEPQLQAILEATLFEPGPWLPHQEAPAETIPSSKCLGTRAGLLLNELQFSSDVLSACLRLLRFVHEQDPGRPGTAGTGKEALILFIVRLAVRVESYAVLVLDKQKQRAGRRQVSVMQQASQRIQAGLQELSNMLRNEIMQMLLEWAAQAVKKQPKMMAAAARVHAHIAYLFKNHLPETVQHVSIFLASQVFVVTNYNFSWTSQEAKATTLQVGEFELFDVFENQRGHVARWLRGHTSEAAVVMEHVERVVTCRGAAFVNCAPREWRELPHEPGNWTLHEPTESETEKRNEYKDCKGYKDWLQQAYHDCGVVISTNQGRYHCRDAGLQLLPDDVLRSPHFVEACGDLSDMQAILREETLRRTCFELVGQNLEVHRWDTESRQLASASGLTVVPTNELPEALTPLLALLPELQKMSFHRCRPVKEADVWLLAVGDDGISMEVGVWLSPCVVEIYDLVSHGRQIYRRLVFTSDSTWSFHIPKGPELVLYSQQGAGWSLGKGVVGDLEPGQSVQSVRIFRTGAGHQEYIPQEMLQGLLPDALLERYKFWRQVKEGSESLLGEERFEVDQPSRLRVQLTPGSSGEALATVERRKLRPGEMLATQPAQWEEMQPEVLVNARSKMGGLNELLARLENLSHILVWRDANGTGVQRVELPRLSLSFSWHDGRLCCDQLAGYWLVERPQELPFLVHQLVAHWGGGSVLLAAADGLAVLVSALAEPVRPSKALSSNSGPAEHLLPGQLVLRRGRPAWTARLAEGSRYYCYPLHRCNQMVFTPTPAAALYLLLCRYLTWHFEEVAAMATAISEVTRPEEQQLWECLSVLQGECHADAVACRLHLTLASLPFGKQARPPWDVARQLLEYGRKRHLVSSACALSPQQELVLHALPELESVLCTRRQMLSQLLASHSSGNQKSVVVPLGPQLEDAGFDREKYRDLLGEVGLFTRMACSMQGLTYSRPEGDRPVLEGSAALKFLNGLFGTRGLAFKGSFFLLYELFTGTLELKILPEDQSSTLASCLLRLLDSATPMEWAVLRSLDSTPEIRAEMPLWGSAAAKRVWQVGALLKFDHDSASRLLRSAVKHLNQNHRYLQPVKAFPAFQLADGTLVIDPNDIHHRRLWSPPLTADVNCASRGFSATCPSHQALGSCPLTHRVGEAEPPTSAKAELESALQKLRGPHADPNFRFTSLAPGQRTLQRLLGELAEAPAPAAPAASGAGPALRAQAAADLAGAAERAQRAQAAAHCGGAAAWLRRRCGTAPRLSFPALVAALMAQEPECSDALCRANEELREQSIRGIFEDVALSLALLVRAGQATRAAEKSEDLEKLKEKTLASRFEQPAKAEELARSQASRALSEELTAKRHHARCSESSVVFDPRLLVFEFLFDIMLRETQVRTLGAFLKSARAGQAMCHQMIMGDGKTTVIAPLLALILADGSALVCSCMPAALLEMSRSVLARCFSSPVAPKAVITFKFGRTSRADQGLFEKMEAARSSRAVVVADPSSLKSLLLGLLQTLSQLSELGESWWSPLPEQRELETEARVSSRVLHMFHRGVLLLDEVDLLLDPLKSELNWPMGEKRAIDLIEPELGAACLRGRLPFHILDAIFATAARAPGENAEGSMRAMRKATVPFSDRQEAVRCLSRLAAELAAGHEKRRVRLSPHLVLQSQSFYEVHMLPLLVDWTAFFLEAHEGTLGLSPKELRQALRRHPGPQLRESGPSAQLFHLAVRWLHQLLPFMLKKVHRVSYGLLSSEQLAEGPPSRALLAVPFVGKDQPSEHAEFSHPDVAIGFSIMAYRLQGLRSSDLVALISALQAEMKLESGPFHRRVANRLFVRIVMEAGGRVRGFSLDGHWLGDSKSLKIFEVEHNVLPLEALDITDADQMAQLALLKSEPLAVEHFLLSVLQPGKGTVDTSDHQLTAAGQDLAGEQLFGLCLGFSGTPNDLLPRRLGRCCYSPGVDRRVLTTLSDSAVVDVREVAADWSPCALLDIAASGFTAFIDVGALITGMSNKETAEYLLRKGLANFKGVVFLNSGGERLVLLRDGWQVVDLAQCGLAPCQRFTFYDHVHTTGMDIKQPVGAEALLTMSKDTTLRDFAQGAYRMRGLGRGQRISLLITPEVRHLIEECQSACKLSRGSVTLDSFLHQSPTRETRQTDLVIKALVWSTANGIRQECRKQTLLCQQNFRDIWRRKARAALETVSEKSALAKLSGALEELRSRPQSAALPREVQLPETETRATAKQKLLAELKERSGTAQELAEAEAILAECWESEELEPEEGLQGLEGEQVQEQQQEQQQEQAQEQEQEQEQEEEQEAEEERELLREDKADKFSRADEGQTSWRLDCLSRAPTASGAPPFYSLSEFAVHPGLGGDCQFLEMPSFLMVSENHYRKGWRLGATRRLRNIVCFLEWVPDKKQLAPLEVPCELSEEQTNWLRLLFTLTTGSGANGAMRQLCESCGLEEGHLTPVSCDFHVLRDALASQSIYAYQRGRHFVALSLAEAEHLRAALHRMGQDGLQDCGLALRCLSSGPTVLAATGPVEAPHAYQLQVAEQCLHFANCSDAQLRAPVLLRALRASDPEQRFRWWQGLRRCRRRTALPWQRRPSLRDVFTEKHEFKELATGALLQRLRESLVQRQLWPADVFHRLDSHNSGSLGMAELTRGLPWMLGEEETSMREAQSCALAAHAQFLALVGALFNKLDRDGNARIDVEEFKAALEPDEESKG
ncbi:unnamed protein product [Effrenium voratum]|uniref:ubiquitinyl hydrolase 1 n=1 Tax=Effrenium voratum TaxID=2562239 RepID=A0AA36I6B8_9DINO|nr:unnamed protein product [Effrenium voratum]CAJ1419301.1 unnamed protein product [Effrenium voratum]